MPRPQCVKSSHSNILRKLPHTFACTSMWGSHGCEDNVQVLRQNVHTCSNSLFPILNYGKSRWTSPAGEMDYFSKISSRHYWWRCDFGAVFLEFWECNEGKILFRNIAYLDNKFWVWNFCFNLRLEQWIFKHS
jgi:hypothetical protein